MTDAQIWGVHYGYEIRLEQQSVNFRTLMYSYVSMNSKKRVSQKNMWPLPYIDCLQQEAIPKISKDNQRRIIDNVNKMFAKLDTKNIH